MCVHVCVCVCVCVCLLWVYIGLACQVEIVHMRSSFMMLMMMMIMINVYLPRNHSVQRTDQVWYSSTTTATTHIQYSLDKNSHIYSILYLHDNGINFSLYTYFYFIL